MVWKRIKEAFGFPEPPPRKKPKRREVPKPLKPKVEKPKQESGPRGRRLATEVKISPRETPESQETEPRTLQFQQIVFGKLVDEKDGPAIMVDDHHITGYTPNAPNKLKDFSMNTTLHGMNEQPGKHPYMEAGGSIEKTTQEIDGQAYVVISGYNLFSEAGKGKAGRKFSQHHVLFIPAEEWSIAAIPQLATIAKPEPMTEHNFKMDEIKVSNEILDEPLNDDWFDDDTKELLIRMLTGQQFSVQSRKTSPIDFLQSIYKASLCLPEEISRQMSFGSGLGQMKGNVRMAHGKKAYTPLRKLGAKWIGEERLDPSVVTEYVEAVKVGIGSCKTGREVMQMANDFPPELQAKVKMAVFGER